jgi:uncharacterized protein
MNNDLPNPPRPWYREPMMALVLGLPMLSMVAGFSLLGIAINAGGADAIPQEVRRTGKAQVGSIAADARAEALGLRAQLRVDRSTGAVALDFVEGRIADDDRLALRLIHPTAAAGDIEVPLVRHNAGYIGRMDATRRHDWKVELAPVDQDWRLIARLAADADDVRLHPALTDH